MPGDPLGAATVVNDLVITALLDGTLVALDRATGAIVWQTKAPGGINGWMAAAGDLLVVPVGNGAPPSLVAYGLRLTRRPVARGRLPDSGLPGRNRLNRGAERPRKRDADRRGSPPLESTDLPVALRVHRRRVDARARDRAPRRGLPVHVRAADAHGDRGDGRGARAFHPSHRWPFVVIMFGFVLFVAGGAARESLHTLGDLSASRSITPDILTLPGYVLLGLGLLGFAHVRRGGFDFDSLLDAVLVALAALAFVWSYLITPALQHEHAPLKVRLVLVGYPGDVGVHGRDRHADRDRGRQGPAARAASAAGRARR